MNLWIVTNGIAPEQVGGSETQTLGLATELAKRHRVTVLVRRFGRLPDRERRNGFAIRRLGRRGRPSARLLPYTWDVLREILRHRDSIDILLAKSISCGWRVSAAKILWRIPLAVLIEGEREYQNRSLWNRLVIRWVGRTAQLFVQTPRIQKELGERAGLRAEVIPNGLALPRDRANGDKVLFVGRLVHDRSNDKGVRFFIEAVRRLELDALIIGDGPERNTLKAQAADTPRIAFVGGVPPAMVGNYLRQGRVLVVPSVYGEGLPNVILEALAYGLPVIATRTAGIPDVIEHGRTGFLVDPRNPDQIREFIVLLRDRPGLAAEIGRRCRQAAELYAWEAVGRRFEEAFRKLAAGSRPPGEPGGSGGEGAGPARRDAYRASDF